MQKYTLAFLHHSDKTKTFSMIVEAEDKLDAVKKAGSIFESIKDKSELFELVNIGVNNHG